MPRTIKIFKQRRRVVEQAKKKFIYKYLQSYTHEPSKTIDFLSSFASLSFAREAVKEENINNNDEDRLHKFETISINSYMHFSLVMRVDQFSRIIACFVGWKNYLMVLF